MKDQARDGLEMPLRAFLSELEPTERDIVLVNNPDLKGRGLSSHLAGLVSGLSFYHYTVEALNSPFTFNVPDFRAD